LDEEKKLLERKMSESNFVEYNKPKKIEDYEKEIKEKQTSSEISLEKNKLVKIRIR